MVENNKQQPPPRTRQAQGATPQSPGLMTFWLWHGGEVLGATRLPRNTDDSTVRLHVMDWHHRVPLCDRPLESPNERARKIALSEVRTYAEGR